MFRNYKLRPMLLEEVDKPFNDKDYLYEIKFDGIRALIYVSKNTFKIMSRNGNDLTSKYPELKDIQKIVGNHEVIFDGEIIATLHGLPSFSLLQKRNRVKKVSNKLILEIPVCFVAFDILYDNRDLTSFPLTKRKNILSRYKETEYFILSKVYLEGIKLFKMVKKIGLEGIVAKKKSSKYYSKERTWDWVKIKNVHVDNFVVHAYLEKTNTYSLFLGEDKTQELKFVGKVSINKRHPLILELKGLKKIDNQFVNLKEDAIYVEPIKKVRVKYLERLKSGVLRHATIDE